MKTCEKTEISDKDFLRLKREIREKQEELDKLQKQYNRLTGQDYRWFR